MSNKRTVPAAILLLITFWFSDLLAAQYFPDDLNIPAREKQGFMSHYSKLLESMKEPPLWLLAKDPNKLSYRLIYHPAIREPVILRLDRINKKNWILTIKQADYSPSDKDFRVNRKRRLSKEEVKEFQELFAQLQFWELPAVGALEHEDIWFDPTTWILEGVQSGRYHLVRRIVPNSTEWFADSRDAATLQNLKEKEGYPDIDRATSEEINRRLVAVGKFLVRLPGLKLELH
jgi:hypothetical protein